MKQQPETHHAWWQLPAIIVLLGGLVLVGAINGYEQRPDPQFKFSPEALTYDSTEERVILRSKYVEQVCFDLGQSHETSCYNLTTLTELGNLYTSALSDEIHKKAGTDAPKCGTCGTSAGNTFVYENFSH